MPIENVIGMRAWESAAAKASRLRSVALRHHCDWCNMQERMPVASPCRGLKDQWKTSRSACPVSDDVILIAVINEFLNWQTLTCSETITTWVICSIFWLSRHVQNPSPTITWQVGWECPWLVSISEKVECWIKGLSAVLHISLLPDEAHRSTKSQHGINSRYLILSQFFSTLTMGNKDYRVWNCLVGLKHLDQAACEQACTWSLAEDPLKVKILPTVSVQKVWARHVECKVLNKSQSIANWLKSCSDFEKASGGYKEEFIVLLP